MAYTPKVWQCNDTITADELNRMEQGIADASQGGGGTEPLIVNLTYDYETSRFTGGSILSGNYEEIVSALHEGRPADIVALTVDADEWEQRYYHVYDIYDAESYLQFDFKHDTSSVGTATKTAQILPDGHVVILS